MGVVMRFLGGGPGAPDVVYCSYGDSRLVFRGPPRRLEGVYAAALGGSATFGKGVARPWPQLLEGRISLPVVNFGAVGAGPDAFLRDGTVLAACAGAAVTVVQIPGVQGVANPYYRIHPRRNDRFVGATPLLRALYPEVDFCEFSFVRHLLGALHRRDPARFATLAVALQTAWADRMEGLLARLSGPVTLLWLGSRPPPALAQPAPGPGPYLVSRSMLSALAPHATCLVEVTVPPQRGDTPGLHGHAAHEAAAAALEEALRDRFLAPARTRRAAG